MHSSNVIDSNYWANHLPPDVLEALEDFGSETLKHHYNVRQLLMKSRQKCQIYKSFLVKFSLLQLAKKRLHEMDFEEIIDNSSPLTAKATQYRCDQMLQLLLTHDASVGITQDFLATFNARLLKKQPRMKQHLQQQLTPLIIRQMNSSIQDWRHNEQRVIREALGYKEKHVSVSKQRQSRMNVCFCIICCIIFFYLLHKLFCTLSCINFVISGIIWSISCINFIISCTNFVSSCSNLDSACIGCCHLLS